MADEKVTAETTAEPIDPFNAVNPEYGVPDEDGFVGVSPEYANFANDTDEPLNSPEDAVVIVEEEAEPKAKKAAPKAASPTPTAGPAKD